MPFEWYGEFVDPSYVPGKSDLIAYFYFEPARGMDEKDAMGRIASESSIGTWTTLSTLTKKAYSLRARAFWYEKNFVKIAYPLALWERGSIANLLSGIAGNVFGMKAIRNLRLIDVSFPKAYLRGFRGPLYGKRAIKKIFRKKQGPVISTVPKPKIGMSAEEHAKVAYQAWTGGVDCVKDDENLANQKFNRFEKRVRLLAHARDKAERETGEVKDAYINVTSPTLKEMEKRIKLVHEHGFRYFMLDIVVSGFTAVQSACELAKDFDMAIHGHRAMHAAFTRNKKHGISMLFLAKLARLAGVDNIHIGTGVGKMQGEKEEVTAIKEEITARHVSEIRSVRLEQDWSGIKPMLPVASGGLHPGLMPALFKIYRSFDIGIQVGGGIHGHPSGTHAGAKAVVQAIEACKQGIDLREYAKSRRELREALHKWGFAKTR